MTVTEKQAAEAAVSTKVFCETYFKDPMDISKPWVAHKGQIQLYDLLDYGYAVDDKTIRPPENIEIVLMSWPRQEGKSMGVGTAGPALAIRYPNVEIAVMSISHKRAKDLINRMKRFVMNSPFSDLIENANQETLTFKNGSKIDSFGMTEGIRGGSYTWLFIDEAAMFSAKMIDEDAIPSTRTAGAYQLFGTPSVVILSTPKGLGGRFADMYMKGVAERKLGCRSCKELFDHKHFEDLNLNWLQFENILNVPKELTPCPNCGISDYEYVDKYYAIVSTDPYARRTHEQIEHELMMRGNNAGARAEILGEFLGGGNNVFRREWLEACTDIKLTNANRPKPDHKYYMGLDFGKSYDATVMTICHEDNGLIILDWMDILPGKAQEYSDISVECMKAICHWNPIWLIADSTGMGDPITEKIQKDILSIKRTGLNMQGGQHPKTYYYDFPVKRDLKTKLYCNKKNRLGYVFDMNTKPALIDNLVTLFAHGEIRIPKEQIFKIITLWEELINFGYKYSDTGRIKYGVQHGHDDTVISLALAAWGIREKPYIFVAPVLGGDEEFVFNKNSKVQDFWETEGQSDWY